MANLNVPKTVELSQEMSQNTGHWVGTSSRAHAAYGGRDILSHVPRDTGHVPSAERLRGTVTSIVPPVDNSQMRFRCSACFRLTEQTGSGVRFLFGVRTKVCGRCKRPLHARAFCSPEA